MCIINIDIFHVSSIHVSVISWGHGHVKTSCALVRLLCLCLCMSQFQWTTESEVCKKQLIKEITAGSVFWSSGFPEARWFPTGFCRCSRRCYWRNAPSKRARPDLRLKTGLAVFREFRLVCNITCLSLGFEGMGFNSSVLSQQQYHRGRRHLY